MMDLGSLGFTDCIAPSRWGLSSMIDQERTHYSVLGVWAAMVYEVYLAS